MDCAIITEEERDFVNNLIRASIFDIMKLENAPKFIEDGMFEIFDDIKKVCDSEMKYLMRRYNDGFLVKTPDSSLGCRKLDNIFISLDKTKY